MLPNLSLINEIHILSKSNTHSSEIHILRVTMNLLFSVTFSLSLLAFNPSCSSNRLSILPFQKIACSFTCSLLFPSLLRSPCSWLIVFTFPLSLHHALCFFSPQPCAFFPFLPAGTVLVKNGWCGRICEYGRHIRGGTAIQDSAQELLVSLVKMGGKCCGEKKALVNYLSSHWR